MPEEKFRKYREKRKFEETPEPKGGKKKKSDKPIFVIQKHDASNLHYDFRIEIEGVLASWAIPKGPSLDPAKKRLAVPTEDHPLEYADFEGVIPEGHYGAGIVMVWDIGHYKNLKSDKSMTEAWQAGRIEIELFGKKMQGKYALIRTKESQKAEDQPWLLIKMKDEYANTKSDITKDKPKSVLTGRTLKQIKNEAK